jgi:hypothetical protein
VYLGGGFLLFAGDAGTAVYGAGRREGWRRQHTRVGRGARQKRHGGWRRWSGAGGRPHGMMWSREFCFFYERDGRDSREAGEAEWTDACVQVFPLCMCRTNVAFGFELVSDVRKSFFRFYFFLSHRMTDPC